MSYILDALKKADAERDRERSAIPGLHTPVASLDDGDAARRRWPALILWGLASLGAAGLAQLGWQWLQRPAVPPQTIVTAAPPPALRPEPASPAAAVAVTPTPAVPPVTPVAPVTPPPRKEPPHNKAEREPVPIAPAPAPAPPPNRIPSLAELPEALRRELPPMAIGGAMYSTTPANRLLIVNNGVFHEGDQPAPGLVLEEIKLKSAVFRYKGQRYSVAY